MMISKTAEAMLRMDPNRKLVRQHFAEKMSKPVIMKDIHNIATMAKEVSTPSEGESPVSSLCDWVKQKNPSLKVQVVLEETGTVAAIFFQDPPLMAFFGQFPEIILMDATHKTNNQDMPHVHSPDNRWQW